MSPSTPTHYAAIYRSGRNGFEYGAGLRFTDCSGPARFMREPDPDSGFLAGVAFRMADGSLVTARPLHHTPALRLARVA